MVVKEAINLMDKNEALILLEEIMGLCRTDLLLNPNKPLSKEEEKKFSQALEKRKLNYPLQYILGKWWFLDLELKVQEGVLIPRPETELLVEETIKRAGQSPRILDIGTGTGAIAISLSKHIKKSQVLGLDISPQAVDLARENASLNGVKNIDFIVSDLYKNVQGKFDIIVSNPPYISQEDKENLSKELSHEPDLALFSGDDGLDLIRLIIADSFKYLSEHGIILIEIGHNQGRALEELLGKAGFDVEIIKDYNDFDRIAVGVR